MGSANVARPKKDKYGDNETTKMQCQKWAVYDVDRWEARNTRFKDHQDLWLLTKPSTSELAADIPSDLTILNDPKVIVRKTSALIARHPNVIEVPAAPGVEPDVAQRIENFLYSWDQSVNQRWMGGLHAPYRYDQAFYMLLRGWLCERTLLDPDGEDDLRYDPSALWDHQIFDPANIYPHTSGNAVDRVTHVYWASAGDLKNDPFFEDYARDSLRVGKHDEVADGTSIQVRALYWRDASDDQGGKGHSPSWWHAVIGGAVSPNTGYSPIQDSEFIKPPVELGYNPWTITIAKGAAYRQTPWDTAEGYLSEIGTGILDEGYDAYKQISRMATKLATLLSNESNPPISVYLQNNTPKQIRMAPGSRNFFLLKEKMEAHRIGPGAGDFKLLWDILMQRVDRASLPSSFYAEYNGQSGFSAATLMAAGKDILFPFVEGINRADEMKYKKVLEIYRDHGPSRKLPVRMPPDGMGRVLSATINASDIKKQGTYVLIDRDDMTPQELAQKVNIGLAAVREKAISLQTFRREWMKIKNPDKENLLVLAEQVYLNEQVISQLVPIALADTGQEKLRQVWEMVQNPLPPNTPGGQVQMPPGAVPGQRQINPANPPGPPALPPGLPSSAMPPIMGGNLLTNSQVSAGNPAGADLNSILAMLTGGAVGGAGGGGLPPVPGSTSPIQQAPPPGRLVF